jgi:hypothetical protein
VVIACGCSVVLCLVAWLISPTLFPPPSTDIVSRFRESGNGWFLGGAILVVFTPSMAIAGLLTRHDRMWDACCVFGVASLVLAAIQLLASYGGICLDPGDYCLATPWTRTAPLAAAFVSLTTGAVVAIVRTPRSDER